MSPGTRRPAVLLVGATSDIMRAIARELAARSHDLLLLARDAEELEILAADLRVRHDTDVHTYVLDVLAFDRHGEVLDRCFADAADALQGAIVGVGHLGDQDRSQRDPVEARRTLDTNFVAPALLLGRLAERLEGRGHGFLCALSSVAGDRGRRGNYVYGSAKAGLTAFLQGLRARLHPAGIAVLTVKPGFVDTAMTYGLPGLFLVARPPAVARGVVRAIEKKREVVYLPGFWATIMWIIRSIPERLFKRLPL